MISKSFRLLGAISLYSATTVWAMPSIYPQLSMGLNMGGSGSMAIATGPQKCFNAAENIEFGWYKDHILHYNPIVDGSRMIKLASFVDVRKAGPAKLEPVIIKIGKYNIQYNQAKDFNIGTGMKDHVTIVTDKDDGVTWFLAELQPADKQFTFASDSGKTVYVNYCEAVAGTTNTPDAVYIGIGLGGSACTTIPPREQTHASCALWRQPEYQMYVCKC